MLHVMLDVETLSLNNDGLIFAIGAVKFTKDKVLDRFLVGVDPADAQRYGGHIDAGTVMWWFDPERDEARKQMVDLPKVDLASALYGFVDWCSQPIALDASIDGVSSELLPLGSLWGNGAGFDNVLLKSAYRMADIDLSDAFSYRQHECYRTMRNRFPDVKFERVGTFHNPADDAESQARHLMAICRKHGIEL